VNGGESEVEGETPISQMREERKRMPGSFGHAMTAIPAKNGE
jgi:hypothetical protein